jgi:methionyl-tRNA formyltransferase
VTAATVLYLGYGGIGCACLADLLAAGFDVVGVLTRTSDRDERGDRDGAPSVYTAARRAGLHVFAATSPNDPAFLDEVRSRAPDLLLSVQYDRILKPPLLALPRHGAYNLHFGPLPRLRGCFPTKWAILDDEPGGAAFHCIDSGIDTGDVIARVLVPLAADETDATLYAKLAEAGHALFRGQIPWMKELRRPPVHPQDDAAASYHPREIPYGGVIDWHCDAAWVERFIRAFTFPPYPAAKTQLRNREVQLRAPVEIGPGLPGAAPGDLVFLEDGTAAVACGTGSLRFERLLIGGEELPAAILRS